MRFLLALAFLGLATATAGAAIVDGRRRHAVPLNPGGTAVTS